MARDFTRSIEKLAQTACAGVSTFGPLIEVGWKNEPRVMAALAWARQACTILGPLREALDDAAPSDPIDPDPANWPGVDPNAPVYQPPTEP